MDEPLEGKPDPLEGKQVQIDYPCSWDYTLIGEDPVRIQAAVDRILSSPDFWGENPRYSLTDSHASGQGKYRSLHLRVDVTDEGERLRLFTALSADDAIRFVI